MSKIFDEIHKLDPKAPHDSALQQYFYDSRVGKGGAQASGGASGPTAAIVATRDQTIVSGLPNPFTSPMITLASGEAALPIMITQASTTASLSKTAYVNNPVVEKRLDVLEKKIHEVTADDVDSLTTAVHLILTSFQKAQDAGYKQAAATHFQNKNDCDVTVFPTASVHDRRPKQVIKNVEVLTLKVEKKFKVRALPRLLAGVYSVCLDLCAGAGQADLAGNHPAPAPPVLQGRASRRPRLLRRRPRAASRPRRRVQQGNGPANGHRRH